ncbi:alpha/beta fold hydrolase [Massilia sp. 9096]|uniref:alpha/beta fold hydrolase n=1 Tax=Massilia sp. 9096 TaxID=1500894 RepID=UPI00068BCAF2|nr:alpha/beta fold hydrolase [Massilia sp. 9096]
MSPFAITLLSIAGVVLAVALMLALFTAWTARKIEAALPPKGRWIEAGISRLHVREAGPEGAPPIVMIHGLAGQSSHFTYGVVPRLKERFRTVALDRPGAGYSPRDPKAPADLRVQADAIAALIGQLGLGRPLVVGHSLGGAIALALALDHPDKVAGLALLAPLTHTQDAPPDVFKGLSIRSPLLRRLVAWTLMVPSSIRNSKATLAQVFGPDPVPNDFATRGGGLLGLRPKAFIGASRDLQALPDYLPQQQARYASLSVPLRVLYGRGDRILDWRNNGQALVDKLPGATLTLIEGGHMLPVTHPQQCADFIEEAARACAGAMQGVPRAAAR